MKVSFHDVLVKPRNLLIYINDSDTDDDVVPRIEKCPVCRQRIELIVKQFLGTWEEKGDGKEGASDEIL